MAIKVEVMIYDEKDRMDKKFVLSADTFDLHLGMRGREDVLNAVGLVTEIVPMQKYQYHIRILQGRIGTVFDTYAAAQQWMAEQVATYRQQGKEPEMMTIETVPITEKEEEIIHGRN